MKSKLLQIRTSTYYGIEENEYLIVSVKNGIEELLKYLAEDFTEKQIREFREKLNNSDSLDLQFDKYSRDCVIDLGEIKDLRNETTISDKR
jgi:hypothetical protein